MGSTLNFFIELCYSYSQLLGIINGWPPLGALSVGGEAWQLDRTRDAQGHGSGASNRPTTRTQQRGYLAWPDDAWRARIIAHWRWSIAIVVEAPNQENKGRESGSHGVLPRDDMSLLAYHQPPMTTLDFVYSSIPVRYGPQIFDSQELPQNTPSHLVSPQTVALPQKGVAYAGADHP
jgi:hypothetical protein